MTVCLHFRNALYDADDDRDGDGFNNATEWMAGSHPNNHGSIPGPTHVARVYAFGPGRGLDLTGTFPYAFNVGTPGAAGQVGDANFTADNVAGVTVSAPNEIATWNNPNFGTSAADNALEFVYQSMRWNSYPGTVGVNLANLVPGRNYKLQLLFGENGSTGRRFDVFVGGALVVNDFAPADAQGSPTMGIAGSAIVHGFTASDTTLNIVLDASNVAAVPNLDRNPILNGVTLEEIPTAASAPLISPASGSYASSVTVSISHSAAASGATIRYTTDGSTPTATHGTTYTGPFSLENGATVRAVATGGGWLDSPVSNASYTLTVNQAPAITSVNSASFVVGSAGSFTVTASGSPAPTLSMSGTLPDGVTFNPATGALAGTPAAGSGGTYPLTFTASNGIGSNAVQNFTLTVIQPQGAVVTAPDGAVWYLGPPAIGSDWHIYRQVPGQTPVTLDGAASRIGLANDGTVLVENFNGGVYARMGSTNGLGSGWQQLTSVTADDGATWFLGSDGVGSDFYTYRWAAGGLPVYVPGWATQIFTLADGSVLVRNIAGDAFLRVGSQAGLGTLWYFGNESLLRWRIVHTLPYDGAQDLGNPSADGVANLLKYAFNMAPNAGDLLSVNLAELPENGTAGLPFIDRVAQGRLVIEFVRRKAATNPGIAYVVETGDDLTGLQPLVLSGATVVSIDAIWERVTVTDPVLTAARFGCVRVSAAP